MEGKPVWCYDYVIVGGGTAGAVVAARLADRPDLTVCLIEEGPSDHDRPEVLAMKNWPELLGTALDYDYTIEKQERGNSLIRHSRGRVLGGCSSHNSCIAFRAPDEDMNAWEQLGCDGWNAGSTRKYFDRVWSQVSIESSPPLHPLSRSFLEAARQAGFSLASFNTDGGLHEGAGIFHLNSRNGLRQSSAQAYLHPALKFAKNLTVLTHTRAYKILLDDNRSAYAVETEAGTIEATREIILCCGAFDTPRLLLLSGIGPPQHLQELGIPVNVDLPGVGAHLIDHPEGVIHWEANQAVTDDTTQYWEVGLFANILHTSTLPDLMFHFGLIIFDLNTRPLGYPTASHGFSMTPNVPRAKSEGVLRLRSANPDDPPLIDFRYFSDQEGYDETLLLAGIKLARTIAEQPALQRWIKKELAPGKDVQSDADLVEYARRTSNTVYHPAGTCKMGNAGDSLTVVDPQLRVRGVNNLRVADASIFPAMISVNPCMTCMMIGEKCADLLVWA